MFNLNPYQRDAVNAEGHCVVSACPGSGKTRVLSERAAKLLAADPQGRLCAVTFTRDAALELRQRIIDTCAVNPARRLATGTFHSLALAQLRRDGSKKWRVIGSAEQQLLLRKAWEPHSHLVSFDDAQIAMDAIRADDAGDTTPDGVVTEIMQSYLALLRKMNALDFQEILSETVRRLTAGVLPPLPLRWMLVDEAQDMDGLQYAWVRAHADAGVHVTIVGDDDQSIYGWRHAMGYAGMKQFEQDYQAKSVCLPINYRCVPDILDPAARLIAHNKERIDKPIQAHREPTHSPPIVKVFANRIEESAEVAREIANSPDPGTWAVLGRTNSLLDTVEAALFARQLPYHRKGGSSVWETPAGSALCGLLRCIVQDDAGAALQALAWVGCPHSLLSSMAEHPHDHVIPQLEAVISTLDDRHDDSLSSLLPPLKSLRRLIPQWVTQIEVNRVNLTIQGVAGWLLSYSDNQDEMLLQCCASALCRMDGPLPQRLHRTMLKDEKEAAGVSLLTMHSAKGLEFDNVWVVGAEQGVVPHIDGLVDEERRLFYVAMTRARNHLIISRVLGDDLSPSQFILEAGL